MLISVILSIRTEFNERCLNYAGSQMWRCNFILKQRMLFQVIEKLQELGWCLRWIIPFNIHISSSWWYSYNIKLHFYRFNNCQFISIIVIESFLLIIYSECNSIFCDIGHLLRFIANRIAFISFSNGTALQSINKNKIFNQIIFDWWKFHVQ